MINPTFKTILFLFFFSPFWLFSQTNFIFPATKQHQTPFDYYGTTVTDKYIWLEHPNDSSVQKWIVEQTAFTDSFFNDLPFIKKLEKNIRDNDRFSLNIPASNKKYSFAFFTSREWSYNKHYEKNVPILYYRDKKDLQWRELINPLKFRTSENENVLITNYVLSGDQNYLSFCISRNGSDWNEIRVLDMRSKKILNEIIPWVKHNDVVWCKNGFFYKCFEKPLNGLELIAKNENEQVHYHELNTSVNQDVLLKVTNCKRIEVVDTCHVAIHTVEEIKNKFYYSISLLDMNQQNWTQQTPKRFIVQLAITRYDADVLFIKNDTALVKNNFMNGNGMIASFSVKSMNEFSIIVPAYNEILVNSFYYLGKFHCLYKTDTTFMMVRINLKGEREKIHEFGKHISVTNFQFETKKTAYYSETAYDRPRILHRFNFETYESAMVNKTNVPYEINDYITKRVEYTSTDGTSIPMNLFYKRGLTITDNTPVLLTAYGGFGLISSPRYNYTNILWAESGGIYAEAFVRGGGEKGKKWHIAGSGKNKQQGIDDFISAAKFLITNKFTNPQKLAITGASHGGLLVAAAANQQPELFKCAIPVVGLFDMLNYQNYTVGENFTDEFGTVSDSLQFLNLIKYSPIHNIKKRNIYPATLVITGDHDDRVPPFNSYKYVAALQDLSDKSSPILLYVNTNAGHHGAFTEKDTAKEKVYLLAFLFKTLNIKPVFTY